jgi:hypothetical protein
VAGITVPAGRTAPFAVTPDGLLYVAAPANESRRDPFGGSVLVFQRDGRLPADQRQPTPVIASGTDDPSAIAWDSTHARAWLAGRDAAGASVLKIVRRSATSPDAVSADAAAQREAAAAAADRPVAGVTVSADGTTLALATDQAVVSIDQTTARVVSRADLEAFGIPGAVAIGPGGERYVAVRRRDSDGGGYILLKVAGASAPGAR